MVDEEVSYSVYALNSFNGLKFHDRSDSLLDYEFHSRMGVTEASMQLAAEFEKMMGNTKIGMLLKYRPHVYGSTISASSLRTAKHLREKLEGEGRKFYFDHGSDSEFASYIDAAIRHMIKIENDAHNFVSVDEPVVTNLPMFPGDINGRPDAMWNDYPVEVKTVKNLAAFSENPQRQSKGLNQLAVYQHATKREKGFLVVICRKTGDFACFEAGRYNVDYAVNIWRSWMVPFSLTSETVFASLQRESRKASMMETLRIETFNQLTGRGMESGNAVPLEKLLNFIKQLRLYAGRELTKENKVELAKAQDEWLQTMYDIALSGVANDVL